MFFPVPGQDRPAVPRASTGGPVWPAGEARPTIRTYTVRRFDASAGELDVDFVLHAGHGPAAAWARDARPGAWVGVSEPGGRYAPDPTADFHVVIGDETALPAVATVLDAIDPARALTFLEVADAAEEQVLPGAVTWVHRDGRRAGEPLAAAVRAASFPDGPRAGVALRRVGVRARPAPSPPRRARLRPPPRLRHGLLARPLTRPTRRAPRRIVWCRRCGAGSWW